jgi:glucose/mannose transport system permease protein
MLGMPLREGSAPRQGRAGPAMTTATAQSINSLPDDHAVVVKPPIKLFRNLNSKIAAIPMVWTVLFVFIGCTIWTIFYSFTNSRVLPTGDWIGFDQYERLFRDRRWNISVTNMFKYGVFGLTFSFVIGFLLAVLMDQKIRFEDTFRTIFLYPFALSFVITGIVWAWILSPAFHPRSWLGELHFRLGR